jgi:hypothetical protein
MHLKNYVRIFDEILPLNVLSNLIKYINLVNFEKAKILTKNIDDQVNFNIRKGQYIREISNKEFIYMKEKYSEKNKKLFDYLGYEIKEWD